MTSQEQANRTADIVLECNRLAKVVARVEELLEDDDDRYVHIWHSFSQEEFEPDCGGCWSEAIRAALYGEDE